MTNDHWDDYLIEGTTVLKNKLNITNKEDLLTAEKLISKKALTKLYLKPICKNFDSEDLKSIHREIFKTIYPFAGEFRLCTLGKDYTAFSSPDKIEKQLEETLNELNDIPNMSSVSEFAFFLAPFYHEVIMIHPFREGNGRTIRVFFREFVLEKSKNLPYGPLDIDYTKMDSNNLLLGTVKRFLYPSMLEMEFMKALVPIEKENNYQR